MVFKQFKQAKCALLSWNGSNTNHVIPCNPMYTVLSIFCLLMNTVVIHSYTCHFAALFAANYETMESDTLML